MARVFLVGCGPLPATNPERMGFPQLRTAQVLAALRRAGHEVGGVLLHGPGEPRRGAVGFLALEAGSPGWVERVSSERRRLRPDVVVSAGPYDAARAAALGVGQEPLWVDVPGDPFAEAQAKNALGGPGGAGAQMLAAHAAALARADAFAAISRAQRHALIGQLGLLGRLETLPPGTGIVRVVPVAMDFGGMPAGAPRERRAGEPLLVALAGGYNTWLDTATLLDGLHLAMEELPGLRVVSTGGGIAGHEEGAYLRFRAAALGGPFAGRFDFQGWVRHDDLPRVLAGAHHGLYLDRPGLEPELGTRTRIPFFLHLGMGVIGTARCELARELASMGMIEAVEPGDPGALAACLRGLYHRGTDPGRVSRARAWMRRRYGLSSVAQPLLDWVARPARLPPRADPRAELAAELARLRSELARVHRSPTWRLSGAARRALGRLSSWWGG